MMHRSVSPFQSRLLSLSLGGLLATAWPFLPAVAQSEPGASPQPSPAEAADPQPAPAPATATVPLEGYAYGDVFSIGFPAEWQVIEQSDAPQLTAESSVSATPIRTEVTWHAAPPRDIVPQALESIQAKGYTVARYDAVNMDGTTAIRIWLTDLPDANKPNAFMSYVGYANATAEIISYYGNDIAGVDNLLNGIHQSFKRVSEEE